MAITILKFIRKNPINRFLVGFLGIFIGGTLLALFVLYPVRAVYYGAVDGNFLLNVESAVAEKSVEQDDALSVAFCRSPRTRITATNNVRTFYLTNDNRAVFERRLPENISYERTGNKCQPLTIRNDQRPNELGKYRFCQEFDFKTVFGQNKTASFCSTEYEVVTPSLDEIPEDTLITE